MSVYGCISQYTQILYTYDCISVYRFYICVCCFGNAVYGDWSLLAKFLRPLKQPTSTVSRFQFCDPLKKDNTPLIVILGIRRTLGQNSLDTGTQWKVRFWSKCDQFECTQEFAWFTEERFVVSKTKQCESLLCVLFYGNVANL